MVRKFNGQEMGWSGWTGILSQDGQRLIAETHLTEDVSVEELILEYVESVRRRPSILRYWTKSL